MSGMLDLKAVREQWNAGADDSDGRVRLERFRAVCWSHQLLHTSVDELLEFCNAWLKRNEADRQHMGANLSHWGAEHSATEDEVMKAVINKLKALTRERTEIVVSK